MQIYIENPRKPGIFIPYTHIITTFPINELGTDWSIGDLRHFVRYIEGEVCALFHHRYTGTELCDDDPFEDDVILSFGDDRDKLISYHDARQRYLERIGNVSTDDDVKGGTTVPPLFDFHFEDLRKQPIHEEGEIELTSSTIGETFSNLYSDRMYITYVDNNSPFRRSVKVPIDHPSYMKQQSQSDLYIRDIISNNSIQIHTSGRYREDIDTSDPYWTRFVADIGKKTVHRKKVTSIYWFHVARRDFDLFDAIRQYIDRPDTNCPLRIGVAEDDLSRLRRAEYLANLIKKTTDPLSDMKQIEEAVRRIQLEKSDMTFYKLLPFLFRSSRGSYDDPDVYHSRIRERVRSYRSARNRLGKMASDMFLELAPTGSIRISESTSEKVTRFTVCLVAADTPRRIYLFDELKKLLRETNASLYTFAPDPPGLLPRYRTTAANTRSTTVQQVPQSWLPYYKDHVIIGNVAYIPFANVGSTPHRFAIRKINVLLDGVTYQTPKVIKKTSVHYSKKNSLSNPTAHRLSRKTVVSGELQRINPLFHSRFKMPKDCFAYGTKLAPNSLLWAILLDWPKELRMKLREVIVPEDLRSTWKQVNAILIREASTVLLLLSEYDTFSWAIPHNTGSEVSSVRIIYTDGTLYQPIVRQWYQTPDEISLALFRADHPAVQTIRNFYCNLWRIGENRNLLSLLASSSQYTIETRYMDTYDERVYALKVLDGDSFFCIPIHPEIYLGTVSTDRPDFNSPIPEPFRQLAAPPVDPEHVSRLAGSLCNKRNRRREEECDPFLERKKRFGTRRDETVRDDKLLILFNDKK